MEEWAPSDEESRTSTNSLRITLHGTFHSSTSTNSSSTMPFRKRLQSLPLVGRDTGLGLVGEFQNLSLGGKGNPSQEDGKRHSGLRGLFRKASISIRNRQRRHSHAITNDERPPTAWNRLKTVASFQRHSRFLSPDFDIEGPFDSDEELQSPIPGIGSAPPIIPRGSGGAAARATAAAQNEYLGRNRQFLFADEQQGDRESGIGIAVTTGDQGDALQYVVSSDISRVDFIVSLPVELAIHILAHLDQKTLRDAARVSRRWFEVSETPQIWREVFVRQQTKTYATSKPVAFGAGVGLPRFMPDNDWKDLYRIRHQLEKNWIAGTAEAIYLNGHLDSIYCVQFDE
jgi:F-box and WD-40 domain protein 1/11